MILVTGSRGYVGRHLVPFLNEKGYQAKGLVGNILENIESQFTDIVIHCAATIYNQRGEGYFEVNVGGTMNVIRQCIKHNCKLIYVSTTSTKREYGITKRVAENLVERYTKEGLKAVTIRACPLDSPEQLNVFLEQVYQVIKKDDYTYRVLVVKDLSRRLIPRLRRAMLKYLT